MFVLIVFFYPEDKKRKFNDAERKAKIYYESCMDHNKVIEKLKAKPLQDFIDLVNISKFFNLVQNFFI